MTLLFVTVGYIIGMAIALAYISRRDNRRYKLWLEEFTKMKKAETVEFIRRLENQ